MLAENVTETTGLLTPAMKTKIGGFYKRMLNYKFIICAGLYKEVLEQTAQVSLVMEAESSLITDILDVLDGCSENLVNIMNREESLPKSAGNFTCRKDNDNVVVTATATNLPAVLVNKEKSKLTDRQREVLSKKIVKEVSHSHEFKLTNVAAAEKQAGDIKKKLVGEINDCVNSRFTSLKTDGIISAMTIVDHTRWDSSDDYYGIENIEKLSEHFAHQLDSEGNDYKLVCAKSEFLELKRLQRRKYPSIRNKTVFWEKIFTYHQDSFRNILLVIEICLSAAWAQGTVERGFSVVRRLITEQRTNLSNENLDNQLVIRLNIPTMSQFYADSEYEESVIKRAVSNYLTAKKWRWDMKSSSAAKTNEGPSVPKKCKHDIEILSVTDSESSDDEEDNQNFRCSSDEEDDDQFND